MSIPQEFSPYVAQELTWTPLLLDQFSVSEINKLVTIGKLAPQALPKKLQEFVAKYPWTNANGVAGMTAMAAKRSGTPIVTGDFESIWKKGSALSSTAVSITIPSDTAHVDVVTNSAVPLAPGLSVQPGSDFLVSVSVMAAKTDAGKVVPQMSVVPFVTVFGDARIAPSVPFVAAKLPSLFSTVEGYITHTKEWLSLSETARLNLTSTRWVAFVANVIANLPPHQYLLFSTWVATNFLRTITPKGIISVSGSPVVPLKSYKVIRPQNIGSLPTKWREGAAVAFGVLKSRKLPEELVIVTGPIPTPQAFVGAADATFSSAYSSMLSGDALRGGKNSGMDVLSGMLGFTGLATPLSKKIYLTVSTVLGVQLRRPTQEIDVMVQSIGDIPILFSSIESYDGMQLVKFIVPHKDEAKINAAYLRYVTFERRANSHLVAIMDRVLKVASTKLEIEALAKDALDNVGDDFTIYCPIAGSDFFSYSVYQFGHCSNFCGIVTSLADFSLMGYENDDFVDVPLTRHTDAASWYKAVITSNRQRNVAFLAPSAKYSPITNAVVPPKFDVSALDFQMDVMDVPEYELAFIDPVEDEKEDFDEFIPVVDSAGTTAGVTSASTASNSASAAPPVKEPFRPSSYVPGSSESKPLSTNLALNQHLADVAAEREKREGRSSSSSSSASSSTPEPRPKKSKREIVPIKLAAAPMPDAGELDFSCEDLDFKS